MALKKTVTDITTCSICLEDFKSPRTLPCLHSFCLKCLQGHWKNKSPGAAVVCPLCREIFQIPHKGLKSLRVNFDLENLVEARNVSSAASATGSCKVCCREAATVYCIVCSGSYCDEHLGKRFELYCFDCKCNICTECAVSHCQHRCKDIEKAAKHLATSVKSDIKPMPSRIAKYRRGLTHVKTEKKRFLTNIKKTKQEVQLKGQEVKRKVDSHVSELLEELEQMESRDEKEFDTLVKRYELAVMAMDSFHFFSCELMSKGSSSDITREAEGLSERANELLQTYNTCDDYQAPAVKFEPSNFNQPQTDGKINIVGTLSKGSEKLKKTRCEVTIPSVKPSLRHFAVFCLFGVFLNNLGYICSYYRGGYHQAVWAIVAVFELLRLCFGYSVYSGFISSICFKLIAVAWELNNMYPEHVFQILMLDLNMLTEALLVYFGCFLLTWLLYPLFAFFKRTLCLGFVMFRPFWRAYNAVRAR